MVEREACFPLNLPKPHLIKDDVIQQNCYHNLTVRRTQEYCRRPQDRISAVKPFLAGKLCQVKN